MNEYAKLMIQFLVDKKWRDSNLNDSRLESKKEAYSLLESLFGKIGKIWLDNLNKTEIVDSLDELLNPINYIRGGKIITKIYEPDCSIYNAPIFSRIASNILISLDKAMDSILYQRRHVKALLEMEGEREVFKDFLIYAKEPEIILDGEIRQLYFEAQNSLRTGGISPFHEYLPLSHIMKDGLGNALRLYTYLTMVEYGLGHNVKNLKVPEASLMISSIPFSSLAIALSLLGTTESIYYQCNSELINTNHEFGIDRELYYILTHDINGRRLRGACPMGHVDMYGAADSKGGLILPTARLVREIIMEHAIPRIKSWDEYSYIGLLSRTERNILETGNIDR